MMKNTGIILLAAGSSLRMGSPKQLLSYQGKTLLERIVDTVQKVFGQHQIVVVLGAHHHEVSSAIKDKNIRIVINKDWKSGMSSSIKSGMKALSGFFPEMESCFISVCDQPYLYDTLFLEMFQMQETSSKGIVASEYKGTLGVPALFSKKYFDLLMTLTGEQGAKKIIQQNRNDVFPFQFEKGAVDIDTPSDYNQLINKNMISVAEAKNIIGLNIPESIHKTVSLKEAFGYTAAEDIYSKYDIPNFPQSSMDGYAIRFEDKEINLKIAGEMQAGSTGQFHLEQGHACRIFTGAPLPLGADTVVMQEKASIKDGYLTVNDHELVKGLHVRDAGSDAKKGNVAVSAGTYLSAAAIGYLAGTGCTEVRIFAAPSVSVILTGNELVKPGENLGFGQVYESNSYQLESVLKQCGINTIECFWVKDDPSEVEKALDSAISKTDMVILVGGVSVGDYDFVIDATKKCGVEQKFHKIRQKPGKPFYFGTKEEKFIFGLPGNPSSALTCFYIYIAPLLSEMMKRPSITEKISAISTADYEKKTGLTHFLKATYDNGKVTPLHAQESYRLQSFAEANCLIVLPEDSEGCKKGEEVEIIRLK